MVLLTVVTTSNPHTLYFDHPIEKPSYIRLLSASLYNSWHTLKEEAVIYADTPNTTLDTKILPGHYTLDGLVNAKKGKRRVLAHFCPSLNLTQIPTNSHFFQSVKNHHNPFTPTPTQPNHFPLPNIFSVETNRKNCHFFLSTFSFSNIPFSALHLFAKHCNFF